MVRSCTKRVNYKGPLTLQPPLIHPAQSHSKMLGHNYQNQKLLIKECDLEDSSYEEFIDSGEEKWTNGDGVLILSDTVAQPTLESLLNNLTLDKPIIPSLNCQPASQPHHSSAYRDYAKRRNNSISWLSTAFRFEESSGDNLVIDVGSTESKPIILYASKMKLIEKLTTVLGKNNNNNNNNSNNITDYLLLF